MTPEANDALHRVQARHPYVKWFEDDGDVILYREDSKAFIFLVMGGALMEEKALADLAALDAMIASGEKVETVIESVAVASAFDAAVDVAVEGFTLETRPAVAAPEESPPEHVTEGEAMVPASVVVDLIEQALEKRD